MHPVVNAQVFRPTLLPTVGRLWIGVLGSLALHALFVSGAMRGLADVFHWSQNAQPAPIKVIARIVELPPARPAPPPPPPPPPKPAAKAGPKRVSALPALPPMADPRGEVVAAAPVEPVAAPPVPAQAPAPGPAAKPAQSAAEPAAIAPPVPDAAPPKTRRSVPLPPDARISFELTLESNNYKVWATQEWSMAGGAYRVALSAEARALFFTLGSIMLESTGAVGADGLVPERYVDERNKKRTLVSFSADGKSASFVEANGNRKTLPLVGKTADIMSLTYDLAFNPEVNVGAPFTLINRDNIEEIRLSATRDEVLVTEAGSVNTRFYDFRRPDGSGGMQIWLAVDRQWLPAKIRILGRDGALTLLATKYELAPANSR